MTHQESEKDKNRGRNSKAENFQVNFRSEEIETD